MHRSRQESPSKLIIERGEGFVHLEGGPHAVLLLHGLSGSVSEVMYVAKQLKRQGFTVRVPTLPGHQTCVRDLANTVWQDWYRTAEQQFETLAQQYAKVSVAGLCMGSVLAIYLASIKRQRVTSLVAMSTTLAYDGSSIPWYSFVLPLVLHTPLRHFWSYREGGHYGIKNEAMRRRVISQMSKNSDSFYDRTPASSVREMCRLIRVTKARLDKVTAPALVLHAEEDEVASVRNADYLEQHLGSPVVEKIILDDCYHLITVDKQRALVASKAAAFLAQQGAKAPCQQGACSTNFPVAELQFA